MTATFLFGLLVLHGRTAAVPGYALVPVTRSPTLGWWYALAAVGDRHARLMLDTGATHTEWTGAVGTQALPVRVGPARANSLTVHPVPVAADADRYDGMGGLNLLVQVGAVMDFSRHRLYVRDPAQPAVRTRPWEWGRRPVRLTSGRLRYLVVTISGRPVSLAVDSGGCVNLLFADTARRVGFNVFAQREGVLPSGAGPLDWYGKYTVDSMVEGGRTLPGGRFDVAERPTAWPADEGEGRQFDGVIGLPWLIAHQAVFDVAAGTLYFPVE